MPWEGGGYGRGNNVGNTRLGYSFIFELCPGEISKSKTPLATSRKSGSSIPHLLPACFGELLSQREGVWGGPP